MFFLFVLLFVATLSNVFADDPPIVILLSFEGVHHKHINTEKTPNLMELISRNPVKSSGPINMRSVFPSKPIVTHHSLSTGVYPETHGIYSDKIFNENYEEMSSTDQFHIIPELVPIWIENEKPNDGRRSGVMMWPGGEFEYNTKSATYKEYNREMEWNNRIDTIVRWVAKEDKKANLVMASFEYTPCHDKRKEETDLSEHMTKIDAAIKKLYEDLTRATTQDFHLIVMSDHASVMVEYRNILKVKDYIPGIARSEYKIIISGGVMFIKANEGPADNPTQIHQAILNTLDRSQDSVGKYLGMGVGALKNTYHMPLGAFGDLIFVLCNPGYAFMDETELSALLGDLDSTLFVTYESGYDNMDPATNAFFVGIGKKFQQTAKTQVNLEVRDVYQILKVLLEMPEKASDYQEIEEYDDVLKDILIESVIPLKTPTSKMDEHQET